MTDLSDIPFSSRELMLVKVRCTASQRGELTDLADIFHGNICDVSLSTMTLEVQGKEEKMQALQTLLAPYGGLLLGTYSQFHCVLCTVHLLAPTMLRAGDQNHRIESLWPPAHMHLCIFRGALSSKYCVQEYWRLRGPAGWHLQGTLG